MARIFITLFLSVLYSTASFSQITIDDCYQKAHSNYPMIKQYNLIDKSEEYSLQNAAKGYVPQITFSAKASYQSDVTKIPISVQGIEGLSKDQYGLTMEVYQSLWDGGTVKSKQEDIRTSSEITQKSLDVAMYSIRERINQLFFGILLMDAQIKQNDIYMDDLKKNYDKVSSYVENGIAHKADLDAVKAEELKTMQNRLQLLHSKKAYIDMLSIFIGEKIQADATFVRPPLIYSTNNAINRPELSLYDAQIQNYNAKRQAIKAGTMPRIGLFLTGGYGRPGLNMLDNSFSPYYIGGVKLTWNISSFYTEKNDKRMIDNNISNIQSQRETFLLNTQMDIAQKQSNVDSYKEQLQYDDEIIALRNSVKRSSEVKIANGTLSGIDLVRDINSENMAKQDKNLHEIKMLLEIYNLKFATNN